MSAVASTRRRLLKAPVPPHLEPTEEERRPKIGRPTTYTPEVGIELCRRLALGDLLIEICLDPAMPALGTISQWRAAHSDFAAIYVRAREEQATAVAERAVLAGRKATAETAAAARVHFDVDRWFAAKLLPKVYGDRVDHTGTIDINVGLADRLDAARKRLNALAAGKVIEGVVESVVTSPLQLESGAAGGGESTDIMDSEKPAD